MAFEKKLHFLAGLCITCIVIILCFCYSGIVNLWFGLFFGMVAGVAKEVKDEISYGGFDKYDMLATWAGSLLGVNIAHLLCVIAY